MINYPFTIILEKKSRNLKKVQSTLEKENLALPISLIEQLQFMRVFKCFKDIVFK